MNDLVSVIIPTYNRPDFVTEAVESVLCQTYPNIELIVVNDGSTDDTEERLQPYMDRLIYIAKENGGVSSAVNAGLRAAKGKYIARLDDDDLFMPEKTEKQVKVFDENPDVGLVTSGCFIIDEAGRSIAVEDAPDLSEYGTLVSLLLRDWVLYQPTVMVRRECYDRMGFYKDTFAEDLDMFIRISRFWDVGVVDQPLAKYRRHSGNVTSLIPKNERFQKDVASFMKDILDDIQLPELFSNIDSTEDPYRRSCAYAARGALYLRFRIFERADTEFLKAVELHPDNPLPLLWLSISCRYQRDFSSAEKYLNKVRRADAVSTVAQRSRDLITTLRTNIAKSSLLRNEIAREYRELFRITYDGISGKTPKKAHPRISTTGGLRFSRYAVFINDYPEDGKHLVLNTFTRAMVNIEDSLKEFIHNPKRQIDEDTLRNVGILKKMGILVDRGFDETKIARRWYNALKNNTANMHATILTTYDCNFACKYCFQQGLGKSTYMGNECSDSAAEWLMNRAEENEVKSISLLFYGGEPLLNTEPIFEISKRLYEFSLEKGIILSSSITTNGSLLDREIAKRLISHGLKSVKVTIDGVKEIHDARRPFKDDSGSFDSIIENIKTIPDAVELNIATNVDEENIGRFPYLLDFLEEMGLKDRINNLAIGPLIQVLGAELATSGCAKLSGSQIAEDIICMKKLIVERGFKSGYDSLSGYRMCRIDRGGADVIIDPTGVVYNCPGFAGREEFSIGDVYRPGLDQSGRFPEPEGCFSCAYFPMCGGGCRYNAYILGNVEGSAIACEEEFIRRETEELAKLIYDKRRKENKAAVASAVSC